VNEETPARPASLFRRRARRLKMAGIVVLVLGIFSAGIVYWLGTRSPDVSGDLSMVGYDKSEQHQLGVLYGKQGELVEDWSNDLKQPGTKSVIILVTAALIAAGCFYFARLLDYDSETH
jgi:hypothetical protein